jgi:hypothetical protein
MDNHLFVYITKLTKKKHGNKLQVVDYKKFPCFDDAKPISDNQQHLPPPVA